MGAIHRHQHSPLRTLPQGSGTGDPDTERPLAGTAPAAPRVPPGTAQRGLLEWWAAFITCHGMVTSRGAVSLFPCHKPDFPHQPLGLMTSVNGAWDSWRYRGCACGVCVYVCEKACDSSRTPTFTLVQAAHLVRNPDERSHSLAEDMGPFRCVPHGP